ncbi:MAG: DUF3467 domain-containing protein [Gammaproteobacteria bacterium]|nr:DUF3467 domain-containing protein [Gammaproteobacteria bacterium]NNM01592.1 DUF3467 domain-containing protein [Gammaproteobacteria bacterium]
MADAPTKKSAARTSGQAATQAPGQAGADTGRKIRWDTKNMKNTYANVCNVTSTREEVVLLFGINQAWERGQSELEIELTDRIIMSPFAAKRLVTLLGNLMNEYESRYGALDVEAAAPAGATKN